MSDGRRHPAKEAWEESWEEEQQRLEELAPCIRAALPTYSCELVVRGPTGVSGYLKVRNCLSNTFSFSSSLFAVLRPSVEKERPGLSLSVFTYNEEEVEVQWVAWDGEAVCALLTEKLAVGNYTFCCGIGEENLVKMDLKFFEIKDTLFEKFGRRAVFRSRTCCRVFDRGECGGSGRQAESQSLCPPCRAWVQAIMDRMLLEGPGQGSSQPASCADPALGLEEPSRAAGLICLDGEVEQELQRMQGVEQEEPGPVCPPPKRPGRRKHPCPHPGCDYSARSATVLRYHLPRHTGESAYCCSTCGARFRHRKELTVCEKRHLGMYDHACTDCSKRFISKKKLDLHLRVHTGEKPFSCPLCPHRCSRRDNLNCHTKKNHGLGWREAEARAGERGVQASVIKLGSNS